MGKRERLLRGPLRVHLNGGRAREIGFPLGNATPWVGGAKYRFPRATGKA